MEELWLIDNNGVRRRAIKNNCNFCKKEFLQRKTGKGKFCSLTCANTARRNKVKMQCGFCGKTIYKKPSKVKGSKSGLCFCNRTCKDNAQSLDGGVSEIQPTHYGSSVSRYKNLIKKQKNPCCVDCKETRRWGLQVHHIDGDRNNNDQNNLEIVCGTCHLKRHLTLIDEEFFYDPKSLTPRGEIKKL